MAVADAGAPAAPGSVGAPERTEGHALRDAIRTLRVATWLGWQLEANWTDPFLFFIYSIAKPVSSALILVVMLEVIGGPDSRAFRPFVVVGSALWAFVTSGIAGLAWAILEDRERYRVLKYVYTSPSDFLLVLVGRGVARLAVGLAGVVITLGVGIVALGVPFDLATVDWALLALAAILGLASIVAIGVLMAAVCIQTRQDSWSYPEALGGALFLVSGAIFPLAVLPPPVQAFGLATPLTWWIAAIRTALFPGGPDAIGGPGTLWSSLTGGTAPTSADLLLSLLATGAVSTLAALALFRVSDRRAKRAGRYDQTTGS